MCIQMAWIMHIMYSELHCYFSTNCQLHCSDHVCIFVVVCVYMCLKTVAIFLWVTVTNWLNFIIFDEQHPEEVCVSLLKLISKWPKTSHNVTFDYLQCALVTSQHVCSVQFWIEMLKNDILFFEYLFRECYEDKKIHFIKFIV